LATGIITEAEKKHLENVRSFLAEVTKDTGLDSHGLDHHLRVWQYARQLLELKTLNAGSFPKATGEKLLLAAMLHDSGMSIDPGPVHGIHSRKLCEKYLIRYRLPLPDYYDLLDAIENHDDKEYRLKGDRPLLDRLLAVADDLDAFGIIGIYRYLEIYIARRIPFELLGEKILPNAVSRYNNLLPEIEDYKEYCKVHTDRYNTLLDFLGRYNSQAGKYTFNYGKPEGECGVAEIISLSLADKLTSKEISRLYAGTNADRTSDNFFTKLGNELKTNNE
jgi:HD superfamily phosphodiesterase